MRARAHLDVLAHIRAWPGRKPLAVYQVKNLLAPPSRIALDGRRRVGETWQEEGFWMIRYDEAYKKLFSNPQVVADLLTGFVREPWVAELELSGLERFEASFVSDELRARESDMIWRVPFRGGWLYVYLLMEFQSTVDRFMALRMMVYVGLLYQELVRRRELTADGKLPPVLPLVLYNGEREWTAPLDVAELVVAGPGGLARYRPQMRSLLLDEQRYAESELAGMRNLVAAVFRLEQSREPEQVLRVLAALGEWLREPGQAELRRSLLAWINEVVVGRGGEDLRLPELDSLREARTMLGQRVKEWQEQFKKEGLQEGLQKGLQRGLQQGLQEGLERGLQQGLRRGEAQMLIRLLERKFGPLAEEVRQRVQEADAEQLLLWGERVLTAERLEEVFD